MVDKIIVEIVDELDPSGVYKELSHPNSGGICVFVGAVREFTQNEQVTALEFETYKAWPLRK